MFLVTGCGRSGTKYTSTVLCTCGLDMLHEKVGKDGAVSSVWAIDLKAAQYYAPHSCGSRSMFDVVLHQVREPLSAIASITTGSGGAIAWVDKHTPLHFEGDRIKWAVEYWLYWNQLCEEQAVITYKVENMPNRWNEIKDILGINVPFPKNIPTNINTRIHANISWKYLSKYTGLIEELKETAHRYGY